MPCQTVFGTMPNSTPPSVRNVPPLTMSICQRPICSLIGRRRTLRRRRICAVDRSGGGHSGIGTSPVSVIQHALVAARRGIACVASKPTRSSPPWFVIISGSHSVEAED